jgi:hypothetical protein
MDAPGHGREENCAYHNPFISKVVTLIEHYYIYCIINLIIQMSGIALCKTPTVNKNAGSVLINATLKGVRVIIFAVEKQYVLYILCVSVAIFIHHTERMCPICCHP